MKGEDGKPYLDPIEEGAVLVKDGLVIYREWCDWKTILVPTHIINPKNANNTFREGRVFDKIELHVRSYNRSFTHQLEIHNRPICIESAIIISKADALDRMKENIGDIGEDISSMMIGMVPILKWPPKDND